MAKRKPAEPPAEAAHSDQHSAANGQAEVPVTNGSGRKPPVHEARIGRLRIVIWENQSPKEGVWHSLSLTRSYRDNSDPPQWKQSNSLGREDLLPAAELLRLAYLHIATLTGSTPFGHSKTAAPQNDDCPL